MHASQLLSLTLATSVLAAGLPPMAGSNNGDALGKRQLSFSDLPTLTGEETDELSRLYKVYKSVKKIKDFPDVVTKAPPGKVLEKLAKKLGGGATASKVRGTLNGLPGQPQNVVFSYVLGIGECLVQGKSFGDAVECGKTKVRELGDNDTVDVPETCNNRLGQLELFGTGWPAPCHDSKAIEHPQGSEAHRMLKWGFCRFFEILTPERLRKTDQQTGGSCDSRFPTDKQIKDDLCRKYFGGAPCGASFPLETEEDFKKAKADEEKYKKWLDSFAPQQQYEAVVGVQQEMPSIFKGKNSVPLDKETCRGGKCGEACTGDKCVPTREVCEPACVPDDAGAGKCNCGWDQFRMQCNSCHVDQCGECVLKPITVKDGKFFAGEKLEELHVECRDNGECYFVPTRPVAAPLVPAPA
ncbi:hypothetical protein H634G_11053 [Metarhizium anisopliae BRIP 53293]|uniref:Uncharacterized protein n=1 Tax=Metarhizium anisopliae BRIP 53293 TaxID=1291518 RepID=A0A0D9NIG0_METAN|nr:hypothetical protein H634G_11053 [Metarhizium anisopliae BRIP 53293]KJK85309.1 hypothetical protein H633G_10850 [Metarhizium anisopliae BRIP 53284]